METKAEVRPDVVTDEHLEYLDALRESGATNMFGAGAWLRGEFGLTEKESHVVLDYWMGTFPRVSSNGEVQK